MYYAYVLLPVVLICVVAYPSLFSILTCANLGNIMTFYVSRVFSHRGLSSRIIALTASSGKLHVLLMERGQANELILGVRGLAAAIGELLAVLVIG